MADPLSPVSTLDAHECLNLLRSADVGRIAFVSDGRPDVLPVNFIVDHGNVIFRTGEGSKLAAATAGEPVAFEADGYDPDAGVAWSVVIKGHAEEVRRMYEVFDAAMLSLFPWHADPKNHFVRIAPQEMSGRKFSVVNTAASGGRPAARRASPE
jgi:uncharacterized protein